MKPLEFLIDIEEFSSSAFRFHNFTSSLFLAKLLIRVEFCFMMRKFTLEQHEARLEMCSTDEWRKLPTFFK